MSFSNLSKLRNTAQNGIRSSVVGQGACLEEYVEVLIGQGKFLLNNYKVFQSVSFSTLTHLNNILRHGTPGRLDSLSNQGTNLTVVGALSRTFSIPSVSGPTSQNCGYHIGRSFLESETSLLSVDKPKIDMSASDFYSSASTCQTAGTASDVSFDRFSHEDEATMSKNSSEQQTTSERALKLLSGSCYLPHPDKEETGGEDAHFICSEEHAIGVADGVGGWADVGINAGLYAQELMSNSVSAIQEEPKGYVDPARVLEKAHSTTKARGSSTACIIALTNQGLNAINLGDSGFIVVRDGSTVFRSPAQQHDFNFTYQLESGTSGDLPSSGQVFTVGVAPGDVVIAGTDGLFDNLYNNEVTAVVVQAKRAGLGPQVTAEKIATLARQRAQDRNKQTPFSTAAQDAGFRYYGGKLDDITVVVSYITSSSNEKDSTS